MFIVPKKAQSSKQIAIYRRAQAPPFGYLLN
jgi:hypothetical protein